MPSGDTELDLDLRAAEVLETAHIVSLHPGDVLVIETPQLINAAEAERIKALVRRLRLGEREVLVLGGGAHLQVLRPPADQ